MLINFRKNQNYLMASNQDEPTKKEADPNQTPVTPTSANDDYAEHLQNLNRVRRRLDFGCDNSGDAEQELCLPLEVSQSDRQKAIEKWNFDFENEVPLEGDWIWEKVPAEEPCENLQVISSMEEKQVDNRSV
ncbi:uncharacterized protein isoform X1 [Leptinotarsa decemlineata]|uniref:uncharacterized protein isoform X1 n=2 Tax=Leptinotarsa decemlineata TaxID=7539 RepID=UPI003D304F70